MVLKILRSGLCRPGKFYRPKFNAFRRPRSTRSDHPDEVARRKRYQRIIDYTFGPPLVHEPHTNKVPKTNATENQLDAKNATLMQSLKRKLAIHTKSSAYTGAINAPLQKNEELMHEATLDNLQTKTERLQVKESIEPNTAHSDKIKEEKMPQKSSESVKRRVSDTTNLKSSYKLKSRYYRRIEGQMFDEMAKKFLKLESVEMEKELAKEMEGLNLANIMIRGKAVNPSIDVKISPWEDLLNAQTKVRKAKATMEADSSQNEAGSEYETLQFPQINVKEMGFTGSNDIIHCLDLVHLQPVLNSNIGSPIATLICDEGHPAHFLLPGALIENPIEPAAVKESIQPVLPPDTIVQIRAYSFYKTEEKQLKEEEPNPLARIIEANIEPTYESRTMEEPQSFNRAYEIRKWPSDTEPEISRAEKPDVLTKIQPETVSKPVETAHSVTETGQPETTRNFSKPAEWSQSETYMQQSQPEATINVSKPTEMAPSVPDIQQSQPEDTSNVSKPAELAQSVPERQQGHQEVARNFSTPTEMAQSVPAMQQSQPEDPSNVSKPADMVQRVPQMQQSHQKAARNFSKSAEWAQGVTYMQQSPPDPRRNVSKPTEMAQSVPEIQQGHQEATSNFSKPAEMARSVTEMQQCQPEATSNVFKPTEKAQNVAEMQQTQLEASNISKPSETIQKVEETQQPPRDTQAVVQSCIQAQTPSNTDQLNTAPFPDASLNYCTNPLLQETPMKADAAKPTNQAAKESKPETQGTDSILKYMVPRVDHKPKPDMFRPVINVAEPNINLDSNLSLSELLRRVRTRNRLQYVQEIRAQINKMSMISAKRCPPSDRPQCPPPPECNKPCPPKKPKCPPEPPKCPPDPPAPKCPPEPPKCPPDPPCPCPPPPKCPPEPPKCPDPCAPEPKCPEKPKCPCQAVDPNDPIIVTGQSGITNHSKIALSTFDIWDLIETLKKRLLRLKTFVLPTDQNLEINVLQLNRVKDFEPWTPIPSWPYPVEEKKKKLQCPQEGCPGLKPGPVRPNCPELPCTGFPKRLSYSDGT